MSNVCLKLLIYNLTCRRDSTWKIGFIYGTNFHMKKLFGLTHKLQDLFETVFICLINYKNTAKNEKSKFCCKMQVF